MKSTPGEEWPLKRLMTEVVGSGPKSADDMTAAQANAGFGRILDGSPDPTTLGAFLLANRWKRNTPTELAAFVDLMRERSVRPAAPSRSPLDCGANYDGKRRTAVLGVAAGLVSAVAGTPVAIHSGDRVPTNAGATYKHVLDALDVPTDVSPETSAAMIDEVGLGFYYQPRCNPGVHGLLDRRQQMGVRTFINTIETLANPANGSRHLGSFYHLAFAKKLTETVAASDHLDYDRVVMFQGLEGYDDVRPGQTTVAEWEGGSLTDRTIETADYDVEFTEADLEVADVASDSATVTREVLTGERFDGFADAVALNAALRLYAGGTVDTIEDGLGTAREVLRAGAAADALRSLQEFGPPTTEATSETGP